MWDRRNLYQDEPNRLCHWGVDDIRFITNDQQELQVLTSSDARYLRSIHANSDLVFFVDAYNDRQGCLRVTQVHPYVQNRFQQQAPAGK